MLSVNPQISRRPVVRRAVVASSLAFVTLSTLVTAPAGADVPEGWSDPEEVDVLHGLLVLAGIPLLLFVLIVLAVYLPAMIRGERLMPSHGGPESVWFGGPRSGSRELAEPDDESSEAGGARGQW